MEKEHDEWGVWLRGNFSNDFYVVCGFWLELDFVLRLSYRTIAEKVAVGGDGNCNGCS